MGGSTYDVPVGKASGGRTYSNVSQRTYSNVKTADASVIPNKDIKFICDAKNPIVVALDVTGSMGDSARIMYDKMPMFWGQIEQQGYLKDPALSFCCVGDAKCDNAPFQATPFEKAKAIHPWLAKLWLEGGGGGNQVESYDLAAVFYLNQVELPNVEGKPYFFFIGDEGFYPVVDGFPTDEIIVQLMERYELYFIHWPYCGTSGTVTDDRIIAQWRAVIGERLVLLKEPKAIVDVMLGLIALKDDARTMAEYVADMRDRGQDEERIKTVTTALTETLTPDAAKRKVAEQKKAIDKAKATTKRAPGGKRA